jgi:hypothetical protein
MTKYKPTLDDILKTFFGPNLDGKGACPEEIRRYVKYINDPSGWPDGLNPGEAAIKGFLDDKWNVEKIKEDQVPKPDFFIKDIKTVVEVKSFNIVPEDVILPGFLSTNLRDKNAWIEKFNMTLSDMMKKDTVPRDHYIGAIYVDSPLLFVNHYLVLESDFIEKTDLGVSGVDGLLLYPQKSNNIKQNRIPTFFGKDKQLCDIFSSVYTPEEMKICLVVKVK